MKPFWCLAACLCLAGLFAAVLLQHRHLSALERRVAAQEGRSYRIEVPVSLKEPLVLPMAQVRLTVSGPLVVEAPRGERGFLGKQAGLPNFGEVKR